MLHLPKKTIRTTLRFLTSASMCRRANREAGRPLLRDAGSVVVPTARAKKLVAAS
jgi:hypothetical protein